MVEYSFCVSAVSIGAPLSDAALSGRRGFLRRMPFDPTTTVCMSAGGVHGPRGRLRAGTPGPATKLFVSSRCSKSSSVVSRRSPPRKPRPQAPKKPPVCGPVALPVLGSLSSSEPRRLPSEADHRWRYGNWSSRPARPDDHLVPVMSRSRSNLAELKCQPGTSRTSRTVPRTRPRPSVGGIAPKATSAATTHVGRLASGPNCWARGRRAPWSRSQCRPISPRRLWAARTPSGRGSPVRL